MRFALSEIIVTPDRIVDGIRDGQHYVDGERIATTSAILHGQPIDQPIAQPIGLSAGQPNGQPVGQPIGQTVDTALPPIVDNADPQDVEPDDPG